MSTPPIHIGAFGAFTRQISDHLEASVAFGLFLGSEQKWASGRKQPATENDYQIFHETYLTAHEIARYHETAQKLLAEFGTRVVDAKRPEILGAAVKTYEHAAAKGHSAFRKWGIVEALFGAFFWTLLLIVISIVLARGGIDIFDYYERAAGAPYHHAPGKPDQVPPREDNRPPAVHSDSPR